MRRYEEARSVSLANEKMMFAGDGAQAMAQFMASVVQGPPPLSE